MGEKNVLSDGAQGKQQFTQESPRFLGLRSFL